MSMTEDREKKIEIEREREKNLKEVDLILYFN